MKRHLIIPAILSLTLFASAASARVNPIRVVTENTERAELVIVLDTSGSMGWDPVTGAESGPDCGGDRTGTVDLCGDGLCSGVEGLSGTFCAADCESNGNGNGKAKIDSVCSPSSPNMSRMLMVKRVLQSLLPEMRANLNLGLVTFLNDDYFRYFKAHGNNTAPVTFYMTRTEMEAAGAWDAANEKPKASFSWWGTTYTLLSGAGLTVTADSLYSRVDDISQERRFEWSAAGLSHVSGGKTYQYLGSFYTYEANAHNTGQTQKFPEYRGPQFVEGNKKWVYNRYGKEHSPPGGSGNGAEVMVPLSENQSQAAQDAVLRQVMFRLSVRNTGGVDAHGNTPTGTAIEVARDHYLDRQNGTGPFSNPDSKADCRKRYVIVLSDGESTTGTAPEVAAANMYNDASFGSNPVKTLVVGLPGIKSSAMVELDATADSGDDGLANNSRTAYYAADEHDLNKVLKEALLEILQGDYSTASAGVTTAQNSYIAGNLVLLPTASYPGWKGKLKALDYTTNPAIEKWEAGTLLAARDYKSRVLYTGFPADNSGLPVKLMESSGVVNLAEVKAVWAQAGTLPSDAEVTAVVEWLAGKGRAWKLGPILRSVPSVVGAPPKYVGVEGHREFEGTYAARERLVYITSNEGVLHAFRAKDGSEAFGYVPPNLWPQIHQLWLRGGQDPVPQKFRWVLASSPRVEDVPPAGAPGSWSTHLTLTMGPGDDAMVTLDVTNPSACNAVSCSLNDPPVSVISHSNDHTNASLMGETWSTPAYFYTDNGAGDLTGRMSLGGGYGASGNKGNYYSYYSDLYGTVGTRLHSGGGAAVDYGLLADSVVANDRDNSRRAIASYQADLVGRVVRYAKGKHNDHTTLYDGGTSEPFYFSPAVHHMGNQRVALAFASGAANEESPEAGTESTLYLRSETNGAVYPADTTMTCNVSDLCSLKPGCPQTLPASCTAPSVRAAPVTNPVFMNNEISEDTFRLEYFFVLYDPPAADCGVGDSWVVRMASSGGTQQLLSLTKYAGIRATGISTLGGGQDMALSHVDLKTRDSKAILLVSSHLNDNLLDSLPVVEVWKEVRAM